jgi:short-subunit dehydrogenase
MTTSSDTGTVLITGPTSGLGKALALELANREAPERPDLLLVGRPGDRLAEITGAVRAAGATAEPIPCDLARLADVRAAAQSVKDLLAAGAVRPLRTLVANDS